MSKRCRFCGEKVFADTEQCGSCGKTLIKKEAEEKIGLTDINSWEGRSVPAWLMFLVVGFFVVCFIAMFLQGCEDNKPKNQNGQAAETTPAETN